MSSREIAVESLYATGKWFLDTEAIGKAMDVFRMLVLVASTDERGWLGVGACHEALGQPTVALDVYALGVKAARSVRCHVARARTLRALSRDDEADGALEAAAALVDEVDDADLQRLVHDERRAA